MKTVTGTLQNQTGTGVAGSVIFTLCNFGSSLPLSGGSIIAQTQFTAVAAADGTWSVTLYNNDAITPAGTYYDVTFVSSNGANLGTLAYSFTGTVTQDISAIVPLG